MQDSFGRKIDYMRISVTDRCNLRCKYCMPQDGVKSLEHSDILRFEEISKIALACTNLGVNKFKITGGEPLVRKGVLPFIKSLHKMEQVQSVTMTTNAVLLEQYKDEILDCGLDGINISLDTLNAEKYEKITGKNELAKVLNAIEFCEKSGIRTKINCVVIKGFNDDEICSIAQLAKNKNIYVRFIEMMPMGMGKSTQWISNQQILNVLENRFKTIQIDDKSYGNGPAKYYKIQGFKGRIGVISAVSGCFCDSCNRIRLTADGFLKLCLQYDVGTDLKTPIRNGVTGKELEEIIKKTVYKKPQKHSFTKNDIKNKEGKNMSQIGG